MSQILDQAKQVYEWSAKQTAESRQFDKPEYFQTDAYKKAVLRLERSKCVLLGIQGLQGTGKSSILTAIEAQLNADGFKCVRYKWAQDWKERNISDVIAEKEDYFLDLWEDLLKKQPERIISKLGVDITMVESFVDQIRRIDHALKREQDEQELEQLNAQYLSLERSLDNIAKEDTLERLLGEKEIRNLKENIAGDPTRNATHILIDMPDYLRNDIKAMTKDIDELQHVWENCMNSGKSTSFVIAIQKEIAMKRPHFFFGKFSMVELKPLSPTELVDAYCTKWKTCDPFTKEALMLLAKLSRGIFRRFLKYINLTLETAFLNKIELPITCDSVENAVPFEVLLVDMELELSDVFTQQAQKIQSVKILQLLRQEVLTQKAIAEKLNASESTIAKIVCKLELYGYIKRARGEGSTWLVSLA